MALPTSGGRKAPARRFALAAALALMLPPGAGAEPTVQSPPPGTRTECNSAGLALGAVGETRLQVYQDGHGRTVELWCIRGVFGSNYDIRVTDGGGTATVALCYFAQARNTGPILHIAPSGAYTKMEWINESLAASGTSYRFSYEFAARLVTITATSACRAAKSVTVSPQPDVRSLERLLPPAEDCP